MSDLVSVIITSYNSEKYISQSINSVLSQTYKHWELIVVDDKSTDSTWSIIQSYCQSNSKISSYQTKENFGGPAGPRNIGISKSKGQFIAFLDADDIWIRNKLELQMKTIKNNIEIYAVSSRLNYFYDCALRNLFIFNKSYKQDNTVTYSEILTCNQSICLSSTIIKKSEILKAKCFNIDEDLIAFEDFDLWLRLLKNSNGKFIIMKESLVRYRLHKQNLSKEKGNSYTTKLKKVYLNNREFMTNDVFNEKLKHMDILNRKKISIKSYQNGEMGIFFFFNLPVISLGEKIKISIKKLINW